jgi:hypothetical protein
MQRANQNGQGLVQRMLSEAEPGCVKTLDLNEAFYKAFPYMRKGASTTDAIYGRGAATASPNIKPGMTVQHVESGLDVKVLRDWGGGLFTVKFPDGQLGMYGANAFTTTNLPKANTAGELAKALAKRIENDAPFAKALGKALNDGPAFGVTFRERIDRLTQKIMALDLAELNSLTVGETLSF